MSWKNIVITGLLCVLASPALAAPAASAKVLGLDTAGNWVWQVNVTPDAAMFVDNPPNGVGGSVAVEIAATASNRNLISAAANTTNFPNANPGAAVAGFAFWTGTDLGLEANVATNQLVAALGSTYFTAAGDQEAFRVHTERPTSTALTTTLALSGGYAGSTGRLAQSGANFDIVTGTFNRAVLGGNANLSNATDLGDLAILGANYELVPGPGDKTWMTADFTGDGHTGLGDLAVLGANYGTTGTPDPNWTIPGQLNIPVSPGAGSGGVSGGAVPEPSSLVLVGFVGLIASLCGRRR